MQIKKQIIKVDVENPIVSPENAACSLVRDAVLMTLRTGDLTTDGHPIRFGDGIVKITVEYILED